MGIIHNLHFHFQVISQLPMHRFVILRDLEQLVLGLVKDDTRFVYHSAVNAGEINVLQTGR